jgi:hypothetical protein
VTRDERWYRDALHREVGGEVEVKLPGGDRIDILTATEIIEVKAARNWKAAFGQVVIYSKYYPHHAKRIHLFGEVPSLGLAEIYSHCQLYGVRVTHVS